MLYKLQKVTFIIVNAKWAAISQLLKPALHTAAAAVLAGSVRVVGTQWTFLLLSLIKHWVSSLFIVPHSIQKSRPSKFLLSFWLTCAPSTNDYLSALMKYSIQSPEPLCSWLGFWQRAIKNLCTLEIALMILMKAGKLKKKWLQNTIDRSTLSFLL